MKTFAQSPRSLAFLLLQSLHNELIREGRLPLEAGSSYPIPVWSDGQPRIAGFHILRVGGGEEPGGYLILTRFLLEYTNRLNILSITNLIEGGVPFSEAPVDPLPWMAPPEPGAAPRRELESQIFSSFEAVLDRYARRAVPILEVQQYWQAIERLSSPSLLPYYRALNPDFIRWAASLPFEKTS